MNPMNWLTGYRTLIGGIGLIGLGVYQITDGQVEKGVESIGLGLAAIGIGGKLDKAVKPA